MTSLASQTSGRHAPLGQRVHLIQGDFHVSGEAGLVITTTLGSCIACCMHDPVARVGGMNHFLLPDGENLQGPAALSYGAHAMELLINGMLHAGARKNRLEAKLFGGGRLSNHLPDVGGANADFAERFLLYEGIAHLGGSTRGTGARRLQFWPASGRVRQLTLTGDGVDVFKTEQLTKPAPEDSGSMEIF